ncbi:MAG: sulfur globule family protein [Gammaproteobacteria bacterium]
MKLIKATLAAGLVLLSSSVSAFDMPWDNDRRDRWHGDNRWNNDFDFFDDIWGDMFGDMTGDFDFEIRIRANAEGWGRGRGRDDNYWRGDQRYYGDHRYLGGRYRPYGPYRHPGRYGAPVPAAPYGVAPRQRPAMPAVHGPAQGYRAPAPVAPAARAPMRPAATKRSSSPWSVGESEQQPAWATKAPQPAVP